jgi:hypothetical protein
VSSHGESITFAIASGKLATQLAFDARFNPSLKGILCW